ncbi:MAG: ketosynthase chain-length factor [Actinoplanes sp.]
MTVHTSGARNAVITGIGVVAPTGTSTEAHWQAVLRGKSGLGRITRFDPASYPVRLAGQVPGFVARDHVSGRLLPQMDLWTHMSVAAADAALADAAVNPAARPEYDMAVVTASSSGGTEFGQQEMVRLYQDGPSRVGAYQSIAWFYAATTGQLAIRYGMRGPCGVVCNEQAGGLDSLGQARRLIRSGTALVVAGGLDASLCPYGLTAQLTNGSLSTVDDPDLAYVPFDAAASGYLPGEGGAILIVEDEDALEDRPAYGRVAGYASGIDPAPGSGRPRVLGRVIRAALADAELRPADVDVVFADAMGTVEDDRAEAEALTEVFGPRAVPVTAPKTLTGRLYAGGGALDVATALLAMRHNLVPHTSATSELAPGCDIDLVLGDSRARRLHTALVVGRGHGGFASAVVLQRV